MKVYMTKTFKRWADHNQIKNKRLFHCLDEIESGNVDANLGANLYKQRIALQGQGKSGGHRVILALKIHDKAFFLYGFSKNAQENLTTKELKAYKLIAKKFLAMDEADIQSYINNKVLSEVKK